MFPYDSIMPYNTFIWIILLIWSLIWKGIGLWKAGRNKQIIWFLAILILNTLGILPIIYILFFQKKHPETIVLPKEKKVKKKAKKKRK
ncbi:MAG: hypothetical protein KKA79_05830 [Nanoarchaeota archaeon]|nr:hypothetical protein [Nanoarchaeota archaeon]